LKRGDVLINQLKECSGKWKCPSTVLTAFIYRRSGIIVAILMTSVFLTGCQQRSQVDIQQIRKQLVEFSQVDSNSVSAEAVIALAKDGSWQ
jgi:hypothetical protein